LKDSVAERIQTSGHEKLRANKLLQRICLGRPLSGNPLDNNG
jgi:hypothetical protein